MKEKQLLVGLPAGSLADPNRGGNLIQLLRHAGFPTRGYEHGGPSSFPITSFLVGWDGRPQEFGSQLALGEIDIAIGGDDWITERILEYKYEYNQEIELNKILSLQRGNVRIVIIIDDATVRDGSEAWLRNLLGSQRLITAVSEMPYVTLDWFLRTARPLGFTGGFSVQKYRTPPKIDSGIVIYETWGKTEAKVKNGSVDFGVEITQTGSAIANYKLQTIEEIMSSETGIWVNPSVKQDEIKLDLARMFLLNLYGSVFAEDKVLLMFNAKKERVPAILEYLSANRLFADEPTMNQGVGFVEFSVQLEVGSTTTPIAKVRYELAKLGATGLDTIPLDSSIPGLDAIKF